MENETRQLFKFELLCIDQNNKVKFSKEDTFLDALSFNESLWSESPSKSNKYIEDLKQQITISINKLDTSTVVTGDRYASAYIMEVTGPFETLESFRIKIIEHLRFLNFSHIRILIDEISAYIAIEIYPFINNIENLLRRFLSKFFTTKIGAGWWDVTVPKTVKDKAEMRKNNEPVFTKTGMVTADVTLIDFNEIGEIVYRQSSVYNSPEDIIKKVNNASNLESLKEELAGNYQKYFKDIFERQDFEKKWKLLFEIRNKVAHNNYLFQKDLENAKTLCSALIDIINTAEETIDTAVLSIAEKEAVKKVIDEVIITKSEETPEHRIMPSGDESKPNEDIPLTSKNTSESTYRFLKTIKEEEVIERLKDYSLSNLGKFIGLKHFVQEVLGKQGFAYNSSYAVINLLADKGLIRIYKQPNPYGEFDTTAIELINYGDVMVNP